MSKKKKWTSGDIQSRLLGRYKSPEWASFFELRDQTGYGACRTIDFFAVNCWPSKSMFVAIEIKVDRADFRRELDDPSKRSAFESMANEFWFAAPKGVIPIEELPDGCGLLETWGDGLRATRRARQFKDRQPDGACWLAIARQCAEKESIIRKERGSFAHLKGKPVSLKDIQRISDARLKKDREFHIEIEASRIAKKMRAEARISMEEFMQDDRRIANAVRMLIRDDNGGRWNTPKATTEEALGWITAQKQVRDLSRIADTLRAAAKSIDDLESGRGSIKKRTGVEA